MCRVGLWVCCVGVRFMGVRLRSIVDCFVSGVLVWLVG